MADKGVLYKKKATDGIYKIFKRRFNMDLLSMDKSVFNYHLLGSEMKFNARDLLYLLIDIENEFKISIPENKINDGEFCSINNIISIIEYTLSLPKNGM